MDVEGRFVANLGPYSTIRLERLRTTTETLNRWNRFLGRGKPQKPSIGGTGFWTEENNRNPHRLNRFLGRNLNTYHTEYQAGALNDCRINKSNAIVSYYKLKHQLLLTNSPYYVAEILRNFTSHNWIFLT
jgi:hypothetical protein